MELTSARRPSASWCRAGYTDFTVRTDFFRYFVVFCVAAAGICQKPIPLAEQARNALDAALKDKNPDTRKQAVVALSLAGTGDPYAAWLESMLNDRDVEVRVATVAGLVDLKTGRAVAALRKALKDEVPEVSFAAAKALWQLNDPEGKEALLSVVGGETKTSSGFITKQKRDAMRMMHTPRPMFLFAVKTGIGFAPVPGLGTGISSMQGLLSDPGVSGRATAALLLAKDKDRVTMLALKDALSDRDWSVRAAAAHSLALRNDPSVQPDLAALFDDKKEGVRLRAAAGYVRLEMMKGKAAAHKSSQPKKTTQ